MNLNDFWYIVADARDLMRGGVVGARVLGEWLAVFRDEHGKAVALEDRCLHRCAPLSKGVVEDGKLRCSYHGWTYAGTGCVVAVPSEGAHARPKPRARKFAVVEVDDYIYARLSDEDREGVEPFRIPFYRAKGWASVRLKNLFRNNVTNCVENFVDIPHTAYVHPTIFRVSRGESLTATVERKGGAVVARYRGERANLGIFSWFLNRKGEEIEHVDSFFMPNVTSVEYRFGKNRRFLITSQSIPVGDEETLVYTDLTYNYGVWNALVKPVVRWQAQMIIDQDVEILGSQMETIKKFGARFANTEADIIHVFIESIRAALERGEDPRQLPEKSVEIEFRV